MRVHVTEVKSFSEVRIFCKLQKILRESFCSLITTINYTTNRLLLLLYKIEAKETGAESAVTTVSICVTLLDDNDNSPTFSRNMYEGKVFGNQTVGMSLVQVSHQSNSVGFNKTSTRGGQSGPGHSGSGHFNLVVSWKVCWQQERC